MIIMQRAGMDGGYPILFLASAVFALTIYLPL